MATLYEIGGVPRIIGGAGERGCLSGLVPPEAGSVLLVSDIGVTAAGLTARVEDMLADGPPLTRFVAPAGEPTVAIVNEAAATARRLERPLIIGLGGGTALDIAKLVAGLVRTGHGIEDFLLGIDTFPERAPAIMIPTTSGTGSEVTRTCIVSNADGAKLWVWAPVLVPDVVLLDPELTVSMPRPIVVSTGLDAFVHALEATTGQAANRFNEAYALQAIHLAGTALERFAATRSDPPAARAMQESATLAGLAIDSGGTGLAHNIGHALGSLYHVPHGIAVAIGLQASLEWSVAGAASRFERAARAFQGETDGAALPGAYAAWLERLQFGAIAADVLPETLDEAGLARAMAAPENTPMAQNNARIPEAADLEQLASATVARCEHYLRARTVPP